MSFFPSVFFFPSFFFFFLHWSVVQYHFSMQGAMLACFDLGESKHQELSQMATTDTMSPTSPKELHLS